MDSPEQLIERFLEFKRHNEGRSPATARKYRQFLLELLAYCRDIQVCSFANPDQDVLAAFTGPFLHRRGVMAKSRKPAVAAIKGFYKWLFRAGIAQVDHGEKLESPKVGRTLPVAMSLAAAEKLMWKPDLSTFIGVRDAAILGVLMGCGLRVQGIADLNESSLQFQQVDGKEVLSIKVQEKGQKQRILPAPDEARLLLRAYLGHPDLDRIDRVLQDGDLVLFVNTRNRLVGPHDHRGEKRRISAWSIRDLVKKYAAAAGLPPEMSHPHAIRHLYGTELAESDVPEPVRQMLMGHDDANSTAIYTHLAQRKARTAIGNATPLSKIRTPVTDLLKRLG